MFIIRYLKLKTWNEVLKEYTINSDRALVQGTAPALAWARSACTGPSAWAM